MLYGPGMRTPLWKLFPLVIVLTGCRTAREPVADPPMSESIDHMAMGKWNRSNLAGKLQRTPSSVAMKLVNFASLDPVHQARGVKGLSGTSKADREVWAEFHDDWDRLAFESERLLADLEGKSIEEVAQIDERELPREGKERERLVKQRVNQWFFRRAVLAAYGAKCCITGLDVPQLLVAGHIIPWSKDKQNRVNPQNGICLNALHDRAFDCGLMTLTTDFSIQVSRRVWDSKSTQVQTWLLAFDKKQIRLPQRFRPNVAFIEWHRAQWGFAGP